jgi:hypothetical protein
MAKIVGYHLTFSIDQGDAWVNAVDPKSITCTMHKECAWNTESLSDTDLEDLQRIGHEEAQGLVCGYCGKPLAEPQYYAFQPASL